MADKIVNYKPEEKVMSLQVLTTDTMNRVPNGKQNIGEVEGKNEEITQM